MNKFAWKGDLRKTVLADAQAKLPGLPEAVRPANVPFVPAAPDEHRAAVLELEELEQHAVLQEDGVEELRQPSPSFRMGNWSRRGAWSLSIRVLSWALMP